MTSKELAERLDAIARDVVSGKTPPRSIESIVDAGIRHRPDVKGGAPYLMHWLKIARAFAYATPDDSWGEFEKLFAIIVTRMLIAEAQLKKSRDSSFFEG